MRGRPTGYSRAITTFLYLHATDLAKVRDFYSAALGLNEIYFSEEEQSVGYRVGSLQITICRHAEARNVDRWSRQLGWEGGTAPDPSWGFELEAASFRDAVGRLRHQGCDVVHLEPEWVGYWSFPVRDPMGNTVEISSVERSAWHESDQAV